MKITFTDQALAPLQHKLSPDAKLKLIYDVEGCGCAVSGVPALWQVDEAYEGDLAAKSNAYQVYFDPQQAVFFEDELIVDYIPSTRSFRLKSRQQTYHDGMIVVDRRIS